MKVESLGTEKEILEFFPENGLESELLSKIFHKKLTLIRGSSRNLLVVDEKDFWRSRK